MNMEEETDEEFFTRLSSKAQKGLLTSKELGTALDERNSPRNEWKRVGSKGVFRAINAGVFGFITAIYLGLSGLIILGETNTIDAVIFSFIALAAYFAVAYIPFSLMHILNKKKKGKLLTKYRDLRKTLDSIITIFLGFILFIKLVPIIKWLNLEDNLEGTGGFVIIGFGMGFSIILHAILKARKGSTKDIYRKNAIQL